MEKLETCMYACSERLEKTAKALPRGPVRSALMRAVVGLVDAATSIVEENVRLMKWNVYQ